MEHDPLELLLVRAGDGRAVLQTGLSHAERAPRPEARPPTDHNSNWDEGKDANDLAEQGWGIIAPTGADGDRLLDLMAPLLARRREQQGGRDVSIYRVPSEPMTMAEAARWKKHRFRKALELDDHLPRYQLILGDLDQVPLAIQQAQATDGFVGRLAFDRDDDYRAYADKLLAWEDRPDASPAGHALLYTVHDGTRATSQGHRTLMAPCHDWLKRQSALGDKLRVADIRVGGPRVPGPGDLLAMADVDRPSVLFSLSHGIGYPGEDSEQQRREQGAASFGRGEVLAAGDVAGRSFLAGGAWFLFSCYGAGTPMTSAYHHWLDTLRALGHVGPEIGHVLDTLARERPFVAALPKSALANPRGPLAVFGHIDLAWSYSFQDLDGGAHRRPGRFMSVLRALLRQDRAGLALRELTRAFEQVNTELTALYDLCAASAPGRAGLDEREATRRAHLWMLRQDLAGYVLLGDPAARLPLSAGGPAAPVQPGLAHLEAAIELVLGRRAPVEQAARDHHIDPRELERCVAVYRDAGRRAVMDALRQTTSQRPGQGPSEPPGKRTR